MTPVQQRLTMEVADHPNVAEREAEGLATYMTGTLKISGDFDVKRDLNPGERMLVQVMNEDGEVIARSYAEIVGPAFEPIVEKHAGVIGTNRAHKAKLVDA